MSASPTYESALRPNRTEFVRESTAGTSPSDPTWILFSDNTRELDVSIDGGVESQRGRGDPDSQNAFAGTEASSLTISYDLQQKSGSGNTLLDNQSNPNDAVTDGLERDADNRIQNTHTIVDRFTQTSLAAANTVNGSTSKDSRQYIVAKGAYPDEVTLTGDPSSPNPVTVEITYQAEKIRRYQLDQPGSSTQIDVKSTNTNDSGNVELEDEGAATTDTVTISANGTATSTESFDNLDAVELDSEQPGDITIAENGGDDLMVIRGQNFYDHGEGDLGIPALGSGSHASALGTSYELYHDDVVERPNGTTIADGFETLEFSVSNNVDATNQGGTPRPALSAGDREVTATVTVFGEAEAVERTVDHLGTDTDNFRWEMEGGTLQADNADVREVGSTLSPGDSKAMTELTLSGQGLTVSV